MSLTTYLQDQFTEHCPVGWISQREAPVLSSRLESMLGYAPRADVLLSKQDDSKRLWIEFEVSRADPVANHAKFAAGHIFDPQQQNEIFISMVSSHVARGKHNLAANTIFLMRLIGMRAFQTVLFPQIPPDEIKWLNHLPDNDLSQQHLDITAEIDRILSVSESVARTSGHLIYFCSNYAEVSLNIRDWNQEMLSAEGQTIWGCRRVTYFAYDPGLDLFAPSKFCAYMPIHGRGSSLPISGMTLTFYAQLDERETRFDGNIARQHLVKHLGMRECRSYDSSLQERFREWIGAFQRHLNLPIDGPVFILPPDWYR